MQSVKGMRDLYGEELEYFQFIESVCKQVMHQHGYKEIRTPIVEHTEVFSRGIGDSTDVVHKEMYNFTDRSQRALTLRPENTASVVRALVQNKLMEHNDPLKLYYIGPMFRYERMQAGRYRQFWQIGAESIGVSTPESEVECLILLFQFLHRLGLKKLSLSINSVGMPEEREGFFIAFKSFFKSRSHQFCPDCLRRIEENPLRIFDCKIPTCQEALTDHPLLMNSLRQDSLDHHKQLKELLTAAEIPFTENHRMVRGLDYYTRTAFEVYSGELGAQSALLGGGRYDQLVHQLGGAQTPAFGWAIGLDRLVTLVQSHGKSSVQHPSSLFIPLGQTAFRLSLPWLTQWWEQGLNIHLETRSVPLKKSLATANRQQHQFALIFGDGEIEKGIVSIKNLTSGIQEECSLSEVEAYLNKNTNH